MSRQSLKRRATNTLENACLLVKLLSKLQWSILLRDLQNAATNNLLIFHKWDLIDQLMTALKFQHENMLVQLVQSLRWRYGKLKTTLN